MLTARPPAKPFTLAEFTAALATLACFETRPFLAVAVSGGADSLSLAILTQRWARERHGEICALTVDHRLRPESSTEIRLLNSWLSTRAVRHEVLDWLGDKPTTNIQLAAREARYALLAEWCQKHGCLHLLTAHNLEDQAETHLIRSRANSGLDGLAGMPAIRELAACRILRPLLGVEKARLVALLNAERQPFITDPSNYNRAFERSRLRVTGAVPGGADLVALLGGIRKLGHERAARERECDRLLAQTVVLHPAGFGLLDPKLALAPPDISERALRAIVATCGGRFYPTRRERIARLRCIVAAGDRRGHTLGGCHFVRWRNHILVLRELASAARPVRLTRGASRLWDRRFNITLPATANEAVTIGYLGPSGVIELNRLQPKPHHLGLPRLVYPILPAVWDDKGIVAVPHLGYRRNADMLVPEVGFHPINPLTRAGFTVV